MHARNRVNLLLYMAGALTLLGLYEYEALGLELRRLMPLMLLEALYGCGVVLFVSTDYKRRMARTLTRVRQQLADRLAKFDPSASFSSEYFMQRLDQECERSRRYNLPLTLLVLRFRTEGGAAGTQQLFASVGADVLTHVSQAMRREDVLGRLDGLDYGIYLPHTAREGAAIVAERLLDAMQEYAPKVGVGVYGEDATSAHSLLMAALRDGDRQLRREVASAAWNGRIVQDLD